MYFLLWTTRNGQNLWEGPFQTTEQADHRGAMIMEARANGIIVTVAGSPVWEGKRKWNRETGNFEPGRSAALKQLKASLQKALHGSK